MIRAVYVGFVQTKDATSKTPVSVAKTKRLAGELMEKWLDVNDSDRLDWVEGGVDTVQGSEFINLENT